MSNDRNDCKENKARSIDVEAKVDKLPEVLGLVDGVLEEAACPIKTQFEIDVAVEEIFVNIASYAYAPKTGRAIISAEACEDPRSITITFRDRGIHYDPLKRDDPDTTLSAEERPIGGLGVYIVKTTMDDAQYRYVDGFNVLTIKKNF